MTEATVMEPELQALRTEVLPSPIRIAATADTHGLAFPCPEADIFIHAGDMTAWGEWQETAAVGRMLGRQRYAAVILIPGNHDNALERSPRRDSYNFFPNTRLLIDQIWEYRGLLFYGSPWTQLIPGAFPLFAAFMRGEDELQRRFLNMPGTIDVLITHGPPKGVLDDDTGSVNGGLSADTFSDTGTPREGDPFRACNATARYGPPTMLQRLPEERSPRPGPR